LNAFVAAFLIIFLSFWLIHLYLNSMFHLILTLVYIVPNIYLFFRIRYLFIPKPYQPWYISVYLILAALYPVAQTFSHREMKWPMEVISTISGYLLPFFLYLFLLVILFDLILLLNRVFRFTQSGTKIFPYRFGIFLSMLLLSGIIVLTGIINLNTIRVSKYKISVPRKRSRTDQLRVAFVSDLHMQQNTRLGFIRQYARKVDELHPDLLLYGGDMVEGDSRDETRPAIESILRSVQTKYGAFGVLGNHEFYGGNGQGAFFRKSGITLLCDTVVVIDSSFYLAGRNDQHVGKRKTFGELLKGISHDLPVLLLDHRPTALPEVGQTIADVQFSGHTHYGQLFPINLIIRSIYDLSWGYRKIGNTHIFVSSGLRLWGPPVKTAGKSEIILVDISFK
jgi:uncharacterized protein